MLPPSPAWISTLSDGLTAQLPGFAAHGAAASSAAIVAPASADKLGLFLCVALLALMANLLVRNIRRSLVQGHAPRRVIVAGDIAHLSRWSAQHPTLLQRYRPVAVIGVDESRGPSEPLQGIPVLHGMEMLQDLAACRQFDELWLALPILATDAVRDYLKAMQHYFVNVRLLIDARDIPVFNPTGITLGDYAFIDLVASPRRRAMHWLKPVFDRAFAASVLVLLSPLLLVLAAAVKATSPGPAIFRQRRQGLDGREFTILKFRSMAAHAESGGSLTQAGRNDMRVTALGRFLRRTSLDELPQFFNVLRGEMSLVGPRPHALEHDHFYRSLIDGYMYRYRIRPGMTGWAQVHGLRGETAKVESMAQRIALDLFYIQHWSFWLDLKIVAMTIAKGFTDKNAY